ncbi:hypothetical protein WP50_01770 [Lactiplantibacillus plantarum]|nr:hypothetical protein WP50_01770 [Lactiplantibacillus plantarum]
MAHAGHDTFKFPRAMIDQINSHKRFGGVVPEVASRHHIEQITICIEAALQEAHVTYADLDAVAVTYGPGLVGALLVGVNAAKTVAYAHQLPLIPVNHMAGHIYAARFVKPFEFPLETEITNIAIDPAYQRQGHARWLLTACLAQLSAGSVFLEVRASNLAAQRLYQQCGFDQIATRKEYYHDPEEDAWIMRKMIN